MQNHPLVSIICTCYNHEKYVIEALDSIINQTYPNIETIIIDDASSDNSVEIIENWVKKNNSSSFIKNEINLGSTKTFNKAVKTAKGEYLVDFAADDLLLPSFIEKIIEKFRNSEFKNLGLVYSNLENINEDGTHLNFYFDVDKNLQTIEKRKVGDAFSFIIDSGKTICSPSAIFKRDVFNKLNGYDESLMYEDLDFWIRLAREYEIDFVDAILVKKRNVFNSLGTAFFNTKKAKKMNYSTYLILVKTTFLCKSKTELKTLLKRVHYEIVLNFKVKNFALIFKLVLLKLKIHLKTMK